MVIRSGFEGPGITPIFPGRHLETAREPSSDLHLTLFNKSSGSAYDLQGHLKKQKATAVRNDLLNLFLDGKKKKLTDIGFGFLGFYWNWSFGLILDRLI